MKRQFREASQALAAAPLFRLNHNWLAQTLVRFALSPLGPSSARFTGLTGHYSKMGVVSGFPTTRPKQGLVSHIASVRGIRFNHLALFNNSPDGSDNHIRPFPLNLMAASNGSNSRAIR